MSNWFISWRAFFGGYGLLGPRFNIKMPSYQNRKSYCGDKKVLRSYLHNGISYTGKMASFYWISPQAASDCLFIKRNPLWVPFDPVTDELEAYMDYEILNWCIFSITYKKYGPTILLPTHQQLFSCEHLARGRVHKHLYCICITN